MSGTDFLRSIQAELERSKASVPGATAPRGTWPIGTPDSSARQQHTSLLVTPASRHAGGRLTPQPNPSILGGYERRLEAEAGYSFRSSPLTATSGRPAAAAGAAPAAVLSSHAGVVTTRFTPRDPSPFRGAGGSSFHGTAAAGGSRRPASAAAGAGIGSPLKKPSLLEQHMLAQQAPAAQAKAIAASAAAAGSPFYRPSPAAAKLAGSGALADGTSPRRATLQEQLRQLQLDCSRTAAQNSTAVASSAAATLLARPSSQLQMQQDFRIRAYPGSSAAPAVAQAARPAAPGTEAASSGGGSPARAAVAAVEEVREDSDPMTISLRLTPLFDAMPALRGRQQGLATGGTAARPGSADQAAAPAVSSNQWSPHHPSQLQQQEQAADWRPSSAASSPAGKRLAAEQAAGDSPRGTIVLLSRINELEAQVGFLLPGVGWQAGSNSCVRPLSTTLPTRLATSPCALQLQLERMKSQEAAAAAEGLQEQCDQLQQRAAQQAGAVEAAHLRAAEAEARATEAMQEVGAPVCSPASELHDDTCNACAALPHRRCLHASLPDVCLLIGPDAAGGRPARRCAAATVGAQRQHRQHCAHAGGPASTRDQQRRSQWSLLNLHVCTASYRSSGWMHRNHAVVVGWLCRLLGRCSGRRMKSCGSGWHSSARRGTRWGCLPQPGLAGASGARCQGRVFIEETEHVCSRRVSSQCLNVGVWDCCHLAQENAHVTRLQHQLQDMLATAGSSESQVAERLRRAEEEWEQRLQEVRQQAQEEQRELASRCQMLAIEKVAQEQAARQAAARQQAAEERCAVAEQRWRQLAADMDAVAADSEGQDQQLLAARQQAEAAGDAVRQLRRQLQEQQQHCEGLEAALAGEQERSSSIAARAETAEAAQHGLGSHVKATHTQMKRLQVGRSKQGQAMCAH